MVSSHCLEVLGPFSFWALFPSWKPGFSSSLSEHEFTGMGPCTIVFSSRFLKHHLPHQQHVHWFQTGLWCDVWESFSDQHWQDMLQFSIWRFFWAICLCKSSSLVSLLCYWQTIHKSILKICPKFEVLSSHFSEVNELFNEHWAKIVPSENISTPIYIQCYNMYQWKVSMKGLLSRILIDPVWPWYLT